MRVNFNQKAKKRTTGGGLELDDSTSQHGNYNYINGIWTTAMYVLLPTAALTLLWGRQGLITKFFLQFKKTHFSALHPAADKRSRLLKWIDDRLQYTRFLQLSPSRKNTSDFWNNGSLLCSLINSAIPGACSNPQSHCNERPSHGQNLAYKYLDITPIFTEDDFKNDKLLGKKDYQFSNYLVEVETSVENVLQREVKVSTQYVVKGMGLVTGEQFKKSTFYIYNNYSSLTNNTDVVISITGSNGTHCSYTIPCTCVNRANEKRRLAYISKAQRFLFRPISMDLGLIVQTDREKASSENIPIRVSKEKDRIKIVFIPQVVGMHQISIVTNASHLIGSPFLIDIVPQSTTLNEYFDNDTEVNRRNSYKHTKKKLISVIIDCIDEQVVLYNPSSVSKTQSNGSTFDLNLDHRIELLTTSLLKEASIVPKTLNGVKERNEIADKNSTANKTDTSCKKHDFCNSAVTDNDKKNGILLSQEEPFKVSSNEDIVLEQVEYSRTSPICAMHIDHEVISETEFSPLITQDPGNKKLLQRQCRFNHEEMPFDNIKLGHDLSNENIHANFETALHCEDCCKSTYTDSYLSELQLLPYLLSTRNNSLLLQSDDVAQIPYYYNHAEFSGISNRPMPKARRSLPNILQPSNSDDTLHLNHTEQFPERQEYWKAVSTQALSYSSITSARNYSNTTSNIPKYSNEVTKSLPNLADLSKARLNKSNLDNDYEEDFYKGYQADYFRDKYLQCRNYWETLSRQNLSLSTEIVSENDFDSGYYASLPNLSVETDDVHRVSKQFREKQLFWENLSLDSTKWVQSQNRKQSSCKTTSQVSKTFRCRTLTESDNIINEDEKEITFREEEEESNLTDDVKEINLMKIAQARNFFRNLEKIGT